MTAAVWTIARTDAGQPYADWDLHFSFHVVSCVILEVLPAFEHARAQPPPPPARSSRIFFVLGIELRAMKRKRVNGRPP